MEQTLENRTALITGSTRGLGKAIAMSFASRGAEVIICGRNKENLKLVEEEIRRKSQKLALAYAIDATKHLQVSKLMTLIKSKFGRLDILVNNVGGVSKFGDFEDLDYSDWEEAFWQNLMSNVIFTKEALHLLRKSKNSRIINISTVPAKQPGKFNPHYSAAKAGVLNLTKYLSCYLAPDKILVNCLLVSSIEGERWQESVLSKSKTENLSFSKAYKVMMKEIKEKIPLGRLVGEEEIADLVAFLASKQASFITGAIINVDGGTIKTI